MSHSMFDKKDYKGITTLVVSSIVETLKEASPTEQKNKIIFITSTGIIQAEEILTRDRDFSEETDEEKIFPDYLFQIALNNRDDLLKEHENENLLLEQTSLILKNVQIRPIGQGGITNLPIMILFSSDIIGITLGESD